MTHNQKIREKLEHTKRSVERSRDDDVELLKPSKASNENSECATAVLDNL